MQTDGLTRSPHHAFILCTSCKEYITEFYTHIRRYRQKNTIASHSIGFSFHNKFLIAPPNRISAGKFTQFNYFSHSDALLRATFWQYCALSCILLRSRRSISVTHLERKAQKSCTRARNKNDEGFRLDRVLFPVSNSPSSLPLAVSLRPQLLTSCTTSVCETSYQSTADLLLAVGHNCSVSRNFHYTNAFQKTIFTKRNRQFYFAYNNLERSIKIF
jgi:hypothetical protein